MPDYNNGKIYTIRSYKTEKFYIGSTCQELCRRFSKHKTAYLHNIKITSRLLFEHGDSYIELLENYPCNNRDELNKREGELIRQYKNNCINCAIPNRTHAEWCNENKDKIKIHQENRKIKIICDICNKEICKSNKARHLKNHIKEI